MDEQIQLRDDVIFQLKQQIAEQQQRIADLEYRNKEFEELSQILIKEEGTNNNLFACSVQVFYYNDISCVYTAGRVLITSIY